MRRPHRSVGWRRAWIAGVGLGAALAVAPVLAPPASASLLGGLLGGGSSSKYIVTDVDSPVGALVGIVEGVGGSVLETLGVADSVVASLNSLEVSLLELLGVQVIPDSSLNLGGGNSSPPTRSPAAVFPEQTGANKLWAQGDDGAGVNVAVLDTGIDRVPDLSGRVLGGVDLSGGNNPFEDSYGHGTFVAGLIAGDGASSKGAYMGEAPDAGLVSIKVAGASGDTDLATVIEGVQWAISNRTALNIDVLNMSLGYKPVSSTAVNPLDVAVEKAWQAGIVVVASAGNAGPFNGTILSPGDDPLVITAGALDDQGQTNTADDTMTNFSSVGPTNPNGWFKPDLVTSGRSVVSLAAPGSTVDNDYPSARIGKSNFVGSGTSFSSAITSGAVALTLAGDPGSSPNDVKARLLASTNPGPVGNPFVDGHGDLNVFGAVNDGEPGSLHLVQSGSASGTSAGSRVALSSTWAASSWNPANWSASGWTNPAWTAGCSTTASSSASTGSALSGEAWDGEAWDGTAWSGEAWDGEAWDGEAWDGTAWSGEAWDGEAWDGNAWNGAAWDGEAWDGSSWS